MENLVGSCFVTLDHYDPQKFDLLLSAPALLLFIAPMKRVSIDKAHMYIFGYSVIKCSPPGYKQIVCVTSRNL